MDGTPDIHFDARYGWFQFGPSGRIRSLKGEPFDSHDEAIAYALTQLQSADMSMHARVVNAKKALEWAVRETK